MKTYIAKEKDIKRTYFVVNAQDKVLGRLASRVATVLIGKHKPIYTPNIDTGDYVIVLNADKIRLTGKKHSQKLYRRYSGYPGGQTVMNYMTFSSKKPKDVIMLAVKNMLPKNRLARKMIKKLKVYLTPDKPSLPKSAKELAV